MVTAIESIDRTQLVVTNFILTTTDNATVREQLLGVIRRRNYYWINSRISAKAVQTRSKTMLISDLIGSSSKFRAVLEDVETVASTDCAVLLRGETGTGK